MGTYDVHVYIYDLSRGVAKAMSPVFLGKQIDGVWHTGIVVYGQEFFFGGSQGEYGGISSCAPGGTMLGQPDTKHYLGKTHIPYDMFIDYLGDLANTSYRPEKYHLLDHNCNTFSSEIAQFLTGNDIPSHITGLPAEIMTTPFGQMMRPFLDAMSVQPTGGQAMFPQSSDTPGGVKAPRSTLAGAAGNNNLPPPPSTSQGQDKAKEEENSLKPFIYRQNVPEMMLHRPDVDMSARERTLISDLQEYLSQDEPGWSPGRDHLTLLRRLLGTGGGATGSGGAGSSGTGDRRCELCALEMLASLAGRADIVELLLHEPNCLVQEILQAYDGYMFDKKEAVLKLISNCCSSEQGGKLVLGEGTTHLTTKICTSALLGDNQDLIAPAITLCYNMSFRQIPDEMELEIGSALLNCVEREIDEPTAHHLLAAILAIIKRNEEVRGLASVIALNLEMIRKLKSDRVTSLCDKISALIL